MMRTAALIVLTVVAARQDPAIHRFQTPRDAQGVVTTASISGLVVANDAASAPLRRAVLTLVRAGGESRVTATDQQGRFLFTQLPAGVFTLSASKGGYVPIAYGAARIGLPGSPIPLVDGQHFAAAPIRLTRGGVITGRLIANGQARRGAIVEAVQFQLVDGVRRRRTFAGASGRSVTDSRGVYRLHSLAPGQYLVRANAPPMVAGSMIQEATPAEIQWAQQQLRGRTVGVAMAQAAGRGADVDPPPGRSFTFAATFFPGTVDPASAAIVALRGGEERAGVDFPVLDVPAARIEGVVIGQDGRPMADVHVAYVSRTPDRLQAIALPVRAIRARADGRFVRAPMAPGAYTIVARPSAVGQPLLGLLDVTVHGEDITDLRIQMHPALSISGRIVFDGSTLTAPRDMQRIQPRLLAPSGDAPLISPGIVEVAVDGTFRLDQVVPGRYLMAAIPPPAPATGTGWVLESITVAGRNVLDVPFELPPGQHVTDAVITFSDRATELTGTLVDTQGRPTPEFFVLAYPVERAHWRTGSRWIRSARAGTDGSFRLAGLPPGEYYLCALTEVDPDQQHDQEYLSQYVSSSIKITLAEGERRVQHLRVGGT